MPKGSPFTIEPEKAKKLAGFPKHESVIFKVSCQSTETNETGLVETIAPVDIENGPIYKLVFRANIVTPELVVSASQGK